MRGRQASTWEDGREGGSISGGFCFLGLKTRAGADGRHKHGGMSDVRS